MDEDYEEMTVVALKALAKKRSVKLPYNAIKDQIIAALENADTRKIKTVKEKTPTMSNETESKPKNETTSKKADSKWSANPEVPSGKGPFGLYQKAPDMRAYLTDEEARDEGFFVAEKPKDQAKSG